MPRTFEAFEAAFLDLYAEYTFAFAAAESGVSAQTIAPVAGAGSRLSTHTWRSAAAGNLGGWLVARTLFLLNSLLGAVVHQNLTFPVHPDPISGQHCWHQAVQVTRAAPGDTTATSQSTRPRPMTCTGTGSP